MLTVPKIDMKDVGNPASIRTSMGDIPLSLINCANWQKKYPYNPFTRFRIAHNGSHLFLHYFVEEKEVLAEINEDNEAVWTDSCVEFFISFDDKHYYNTEFSCIGRTLLAYRSERNDAIRAEKDILKSIERFPSLGSEPFGRIAEPVGWDLLLVIPVSAYWKSGLRSFDKIRATANFYKCGDHLSEPHYVSWNPIETENPDFHRPEFFGEIYFE